MYLPKRDIIATGLVAVAGLLYLLWAIDSALPGMSSTRATGVAILALGFAASANAVVPGFDQLIHGNKTYLVITSLIGMAALAAGVQMLFTASGAGLTVVMAAMAVLWLIATIHHSILVKIGSPRQVMSQQGGAYAPIPGDDQHQGDNHLENRLHPGAAAPEPDLATDQMLLEAGACPLQARSGSKLVYSLQGACGMC